VIGQDIIVTPTKLHLYDVYKVVEKRCTKFNAP